LSSHRQLSIIIYYERIKFFRAFNAIYAKLSTSASVSVTLSMTQSFCAPILYYGLECVFMSKSLADSLNFCWSRVMYKIFNISESACAETIMFYMGHLPLSYQLDLCRLRFYHYMYYNFLSGDTIVWHVANDVKRRLIDQLFLNLPVQKLLCSIWVIYLCHISLISAGFGFIIICTSTFLVALKLCGMLPMPSSAVLLISYFVPITYIFRVQ